MRKLVLLGASVPLLFGPPAMATDTSQPEPICRPPDVNHSYDCNVDVALDHQPVDDSVYEVEITSPGADPDADETTRLTLFCTSDGDAAVCDTQAR